MNKVFYIIIALNFLFLTSCKTENPELASIIIKEKIDKNEEPPKIYKNKGWKGISDFLGKE